MTIRRKQYKTFMTKKKKKTFMTWDSSMILKMLATGNKRYMKFKNLELRVREGGRLLERKLSG